MLQISFWFSRYCKTLIVLAGLSAALSLGQVSWSTPEALSNQELAARIEAVQAPVILDVRSPEEFAAGHIPGAVNLPHREIANRLDEVPAAKEEEVVVYCERGGRAGLADLALEQAGFQQVLTLTGDMQAWRQANLPIETVAP